jgi:hypothetical protein
MRPPLARLRPAITGTSCLLLLAACGGGTRQEGPAPDPPSRQFVVRGEVFSINTGMIANAPINLWIESGDRGW